jgi:hypothetical protein
VSELIGSAELEIGVDLAPLDVGLKDSEKKVAQGVAVLQRIIDNFVDRSGAKVGSLAVGIGEGLSHAFADASRAGAEMAAEVTAALGEVDAAQEQVRHGLEETAAVAVAAADVEVAAADRVTAAYLEQAAAARLAAAASPGVGATGLLGIATPVRVPGQEGHDRFVAIEGVRGAGHAGSRTNPLVVVLEASRYTSLGALGAGIADNPAIASAASAGGAGGQGGTGAPPVAATGPQGRPEAIGAAAAADRHREQREDALADALAALAAVKSQAPPPSQPRQTGAVILPGGEQQPAAGQRTVILPTGVGSEKVSHGVTSVPVVVTDAEPRAADAISQAATEAVMAELASKTLAPGEWAKAGPEYVAGYAAHGLQPGVAPDNRLRLYGMYGGSPAPRTSATRARRR